MIQQVEDAVRDTVGYNQTANKGSFMAGAKVGFSKAEDFYKKLIENLISERDALKKVADTATDDLKTVSKIISKYSE